MRKINRMFYFRTTDHVNILPYLNFGFTDKNVGVGLEMNIGWLIFNWYVSFYK